MTLPVSDKISLKEFSERIDNRNQVIKNFWEYQTCTEEPLEAVMDPIEIAVELVNKSKEAIYLYSPYITSSELLIALENAVQRKVRIYSLTSDINQHIHLFQQGIMREKEDITSSFVIIDPKERICEGVFFAGELTQRSRTTPFILFLNSKQVKEVWAQFIYYFWNAGGRELFHGKTQGVRGIKPDLPKIPEIMRSVLRKAGLNTYLSSNKIEELWIPVDFPQDMLYYYEEAKNLVVEINEASKNLINWDDVNRLEIHGINLLPFSLIKLSDSQILFKNNLCFILTRKQVKELNSRCPRWSWKYRKNDVVDNIKNPIIKFESDWNEKSAERVRNKLPEKLKDLHARNMEEWLSDKPKPTIESKIRLGREITFLWTLHPPYLPHNAIKHRLYDRWGKFIDELKKRIAGLQQHLEVLLRNEKTKNFIAERGVWQDWANELNSLLNRNWFQSDISEMKDLVKRIEEIKKSLNIDSRTSSTNIHPQEGKNERPKIREFNELEIFKRGSKNKESFDVENELEIFNNLSNQHKKSEKVKLTRLIDMIPLLPLPKLGTLYELESTNYLVIEKKSQIEQAKKIAKRYQAKIVVKRDD